MSEISRRVQKRTLQRIDRYRSIALTACWFGIGAGVMSILISLADGWSVFLKSNVVISLLSACVSLFIAHLIWRRQATLIRDMDELYTGTLKVAEIQFSDLGQKEREALIRYGFENDISTDQMRLER